MSQIDPADKYAAVTPHDSNTLTYDSEYAFTRAIACGATGNIETVNSVGDAIVHYCVAGVMYPIQTQLIKDANTTATSIVAYF